MVDVDGNKKMVLGVCGKAYFMSCDNNYQAYEDGFTAEELKEEGYKPLLEEPEEDEEAQEAIKLLEEKGLLKNGKILSK